MKGNHRHAEKYTQLVCEECQSIKDIPTWELLQRKLSSKSGRLFCSMTCANRYNMRVRREKAKT